MTEVQFIKITSFFRKNKFRENSLKFFCTFTPLLVAFIYAITIIFLIINKDKNLNLFLFVPASNFLFISVMRKLLNKSRPYDLFNHTPIVKYSKGKGKSFPSRHTSSAFVIAISYFYINYIYIGLFMLAVACIVGLSRIIAGVHFPRDIIAAALISIIWAIAGFSI